MDSKEAWKKLIGIFPQYKPSPTMFEEFSKVIDKFAPSVIARAYEHTKQNETRFPTIALFRAYCFEFQDQENQRRHKEQMENEAKTAKAFFHDPKFGGNDDGKACAMNIRTALAGKVTRREFIENCRTLKIDAGAYLNYIQEHDLDLDNIMGAEHMHNFEDTKGKPVEKKAIRAL